MKNTLAVFENFKIRRIYDEKSETWFFSVVDIIAVLTEQYEHKKGQSYWTTLKNRLKKEGSEDVTKCDQLKEEEYAILTNIIHQEWLDLTVKDHKSIRSLNTQDLRDHMSEAELIFTALAELSTCQIAETTEATGMEENKVAGKTGGGIAKRARLDLEEKTGKKIVSRQNYLPPKNIKEIQGKNYAD